MVSIDQGSDGEIVHFLMLKQEGDIFEVAQKDLERKETGRRATSGKACVRGFTGSAEAVILPYSTCCCHGLEYRIEQNGYEFQAGSIL